MYVGSMLNQTVKTLGYMLLILIILHESCSEEHKHRVKRRVVFSKNSKLFFRLNGKVNVIPWTQIFAQGWAIRVNWDLPDTLHRRHKFFKRDIETDLQNLESIPATKGYSCILDYMCKQLQIMSSSRKCGMYCEVGNIINSSRGVESEFFRSLLTKCGSFSEICSSIQE